jgi:hypothetical protein
MLAHEFLLVPQRNQIARQASGNVRRMRECMRLASLISLGLVLAAGCGGGARDFDDICHAEERAGVSGVTDPAEKAMRIAEWIDLQLRTSDARKSMAALASVPCEHKGPILIQAAKEAGYTDPCPMADYSARTCAKPGPAAPR